MVPNSGYLLNRFYKSLSSAPSHEICQICPTPPGCNDTSLHLAWMEGLQVFLRSLATFSNLQRVNLEDSDKSSYHRLYYYNLAFFSIQISFSHQKSRQQQQVGGVLKTKQFGKDFQVCWCSGFVEFLRSLPSVDTAILIQPPMAAPTGLSPMGVVFSPSNFAREIAKSNRSTTFVEEAFSRGLKRETRLACSLQAEWFGLRKEPLFLQGGAGWKDLLVEKRRTKKHHV